MNILAIGAHPDDIELGAAATLFKHSCDGDLIHYLVMTGGEGGQAPVAERKLEAGAAAHALPTNSFEFGNVSALELCSVQQKFVEIIEAKIDQVNPDRIYTHTRHDRHQNHEVAARCVEIAARNVGQILSFELPSTRYGDFTPNWFSVFDVHGMRKKLDLIYRFASQRRKPYMQESVVRSRAIDWATRAGTRWEYAEAFCVERFIA